MKRPNTFIFASILLVGLVCWARPFFASSSRPSQVLPRIPKTPKLTLLARYPDYDPEVAVYNGFSEDAFSPERASNWADPAGGFIHAMHRARWGGYHYQITGKDEEGKIQFEGG